MGLTLLFKLANYLIKMKNDALATMFADMQKHKTLDKTGQLALMLEECDADTFLKHPETLVIGMQCYLGDNVTLKILVGILQTHMPDFNITDLHACGLPKLGKYYQCNNSKIEKVILDALSGLREFELERVKLLLLWKIDTDYDHMSLGSIANSSPFRLTKQIFSMYSEHTAWVVMSLIFAQIQRPDLVEQLTTAAAYRAPLQIKGETHEMGLTRMFKMVNYLMRKKAAFATVVANIQAHKALPSDSIDQLALMFEECGADTLLKHPEALVSGASCYLGHDVTWNILLGILKMHMSDFSFTDLCEHGLEKLEKYVHCKGSKIEKVILDALLNLRECELDRVKMLLSWEIIMNYGHIRLAHIEHSSPHLLTKQIFSGQSEHAAYLMTLIFTQIQRQDLVEKLTAAMTPGTVQPMRSQMRRGKKTLHLRPR